MTQAREIRDFKITEYRFIQPETVTDGEVTETRAPRLEGYAAVYNSDSVLMWENGEEFVERLSPGAFTRSLSTVGAGDHVVALWSHDTSKPLASTRNDNLILKEDDKGLWFSMSLERMDPMMLAAARDGDVQMSFGMFIREREWTRRDDGTRVRTITDLDLFEISPVVFPAFPATEAAVRCFKKWKADNVDHENIDETRADHTVQLARIRLKKARLKSKIALNAPTKGR